MTERLGWSVRLLARPQIGQREVRRALNIRDSQKGAQAQGDRHSPTPLLDVEPVRWVRIKTSQRVRFGLTGPEAGFNEVQRLQHQFPERRDRKYAAIVARAI